MKPLALAADAISYGISIESEHMAQACVIACYQQLGYFGFPSAWGPWEPPSEQPRLFLRMVNPASDRLR